MQPTKRLASILVPLVGLSATPIATQAQRLQLTIPTIMRGPDLVGEAPQALRGGFGGTVYSWSPDGAYVYFRWKQPGVDTAAAPYRVAVQGGAPEPLDARAADTVLAGPAVWDADGRRALYVISGDIVLWSEREARYLTRTHDQENSPVWSSDGNAVYFRRGDNYYALALEDGGLRQLTDIRSGAGPRDSAEARGQRRFLQDQERQLIEFVRNGHYRNQPWFRRPEPRDSTQPEPFFPGAGQRVQNVSVTPDGAYALVNVTKPATGARRVDLPVWITAEGYTDVEQIRTKVGDAQSSSRVAIIQTATGHSRWVGEGVGDGERDIRGVDLSPNSRYALLRVETHDDEHRWYVVVDLATGDERVVDHLHDAAWLAGPSYNTAGFLPDGETVYFGSEKTGWAHLYTVPATGGEATALTSGEWEVLDASLSRDGRQWYLTANREGFADVHFYTMPVRGGEMTRVTSGEGRFDAAPSPDGRWLAIRHSESNRPPELFLQENAAGREMRQVTLSTTEEWRSYDWIKPEIVMIPARDGVMVPARLYRPHDPAPAGERPAVVFVHGAGYLQNVHHWWSSYYREYMFHHLLAERGYTVLDMDYRGSAGHGRDWRTAIYRHMGGQDLTDQVDGARWLVETMGVHPERIGIYGGSYGGFITLMAMFTAPGVFESGAALRPVTDWAHYNHGYTSNILNEPQNDSLAYQQSSPIYFADGLRGHLLIAHGMVDDNVHFSDTVRLVQRLIELGKTNWNVAIYPVERHGFTEPSSWTDEYRRIFELFERTLK